jgi:flagellar motor switch protein FliN
MQSFLQESERAESAYWETAARPWGERLARALETMAGSPVGLGEVEVEPSPSSPPGWSVETAGTTLGLDDGDARVLLSLLAAATPDSAAPLDDAQRAVLREGLAQLAQTIEPGSPDRSCGPLQEDALPSGACTRVALRLTTEAGPLQVQLWAPRGRRAAAETPVRAVAPGQNLGVLLDVPLRLHVVLGAARVPLKDLLAVGPGSLLELERKTAEPLEILVNGRMFGHGEVVVVDDRFAIRVIDVVEEAG